jgi:hypothetical protein
MCRQRRMAKITLLQPPSHELLGRIGEGRDIASSTPPPTRRESLAQEPAHVQSMTRNITARTTRLATASNPLGMNLRVLAA